MRRFLLVSGVLAAVLSLCLGCSTPPAVLAASQGSIRDLRLLNDQVVPQLPADLQVDWTENLIAFVVREQVIHAYLNGDKHFDQRAAEAAEAKRVLAARKAAPDG